MNDSQLERLLRSAAQAPGDEIDPAPPLGFATRVVALARESKPNGIAALLRRITLVSAALLAVTSAAVFWQVQQNSESSDTISNEFAIADSAITTEFGQ